MFGDRELMEPITVFGPNVEKAIMLVGEFWLATRILYELAPGTLVHLKIAVLDVTENTDNWGSEESNERNGNGTYQPQTQKNVCGTFNFTWVHFCLCICTFKSNIFPPPLIIQLCDSSSSYMTVIRYLRVELMLKEQNSTWCCHSLQGQKRK